MTDYWFADRQDYLLGYHEVVIKTKKNIRISK